jgi:hypothetical protein
MTAKRDHKSACGHALLGLVLDKCVGRGEGQLVAFPPWVCDVYQSNHIHRSIILLVPYEHSFNKKLCPQKKYHVHQALPNNPLPSN